MIKYIDEKCFHVHVDFVITFDDCAVEFAGFSVCARKPFEKLFNFRLLFPSIAKTGRSVEMYSAVCFYLFHDYFLF